MNIYVKVGDMQQSASITGRLNDKDWDNRASKAITLEMSYEDAINTFIDNIAWYIVQENEEIIEVYDEKTESFIQETVIKTEDYDNSEYSIAGSITDNRDGTITVKMGKPTAEEMLSQNIAETDAMIVDYEYKIALLELGIAE